MSNQVEVFRAIKRDRQERHLNDHKKNMHILNQLLLGRYQVKNQGECCIFREIGKPNVDFDPSTGRWRVYGQKRTLRGGGYSFVQWYNRTHSINKGKAIHWTDLKY